MKHNRLAGFSAYLVVLGVQLAKKGGSKANEHQLLVSSIEE